jgi:hypothetical protein
VVVNWKILIDQHSTHEFTNSSLTFPRGEERSGFCHPIYDGYEVHCDVFATSVRNNFARSGTHIWQIAIFSEREKGINFFSYFLVTQEFVHTANSKIMV